MTSWTEIAKSYAKDATNKKNCKRFGKWIRLAGDRFIKDLDRSRVAGNSFEYSDVEAGKVCDFISNLPHVEGEWKSENITLEPFQVFFLCNLFGFRNLDGTRRFTSALFAMARKNAKALALNTPLPTPTGWKYMRDIMVGDQLLGADGLPCTVTAMSEVYVGHDCYEIIFSNKDKIIADGGHLWVTKAHVDNIGGKKTGRNTLHRVRTTEEIFNTLRYGKRRDNNHSIPMPFPIDLPARELPIKPYTFGAWLGNGHSESGNITFMPEDKEVSDSIISDGYPLRKMHNNGSKAWTFSISDGDRTQKARNSCFASVLRKNCLICNKHIPAVYLRASKEQRLALLQGLMDSDGTINKNGRVIAFTTIRKGLAVGVGELLSTFGIKFSIRKDKLVCNGRKLDGFSYKLQFMAFRDDLPCFRLARKLNRMRSRSKCATNPRSRTLQIIDIKKVDSVPVKCVTVDNGDKQFLAGITMIPTHNSSLAAGIGLYCLTMENEKGPQIISGATTGDQAAIVFKIAKRMADKKPQLREAFNVECFTRAIACYESGGLFKPINAKASTQDGLNPSCAILDEIHAHKSHDFLNVLQSAAGGRRSPLFLFTTTEGYETPGPWPEMRKFAQQVLEGVIEADHFLVIFYALDDKDNEFDESVWEKSNPLLSVSEPLLKAIRKEATEAKSMPGRHAEFLIKRMNRQSSTANGWIDLQKWKACASRVPLDELKDEPSYGALDLASTRDLASFRIVWKKDGIIYTHGWRWVPQTTVAIRAQRNLVPYAGWVKAGFMTETVGEVTDYDEIFKKVLWVRDNFNLISVGYDSWNSAQLASKISAEDIEMIQFIQGPKSYHPAMKAFEEAYISSNFRHGGDPVLTWCASNLVARMDVNLNMAPDKKKSADKIDDMTALLMAVGIMIGQESDGDGSLDDFLDNPISIKQ